MKKILPILAMLFASSAIAQEAAVVLTWDPVDDTRVGVYELHYGPTSVAPSVIASVAQPAESTYYYAVRACTTDLTLCSAFSNEISNEVGAMIDTPTGVRVQSTTFVP